MKFILTIVVTFSLFTVSTAQLTYSDGDNTHLWGPIEISQLEEKPFYEWYSESQNEYTPYLESSKFKDLKDVTVKIFLGTWCGDTKNYLPKFIELWESADLPMDNLELIAVHDSTELYKQGPNHEEEGYNLHRVPTFIFERGGQEFARIVEYPVTDLDTDVAQIAAGLPPRHSYRGVTALQEFFATTEADSIESKYMEIARDLFGMTKHAGELTTYAKKLQTEGEIDKANFVYRMNTTIYRYHPYAFFKLGSFQFDCEKYEDAKINFEKCLEIRSDYPNAQEYLDDIAGLLQKEKQ